MLRINYDIVGYFIAEFKVGLARSNNFDFDLDKMFRSLLSPEFPENLFEENNLESLKIPSKQDLGSQLINAHSVKNFIKQVFTLDTKDYADLMNCFPENDFACQFFNITEHKWLKRLRKILLQNVKTNVKFNVKLEIFSDEFEKHGFSPFEWKLLSKDPLGIRCALPALEKQVNFESFSQSDEFKIRFIAKKQIDLKACMADRLNVAPLFKHHFEKVIIHIHGGGFISMTSSSHLAYLTKFVKESGAVLFTIDYPLAPQNKYPVIIDCIFKAYLTIIVG